MGLFYQSLRGVLHHIHMISQEEKWSQDKLNVVIGYVRRMCDNDPETFHALGCHGMDTTAAGVCMRFEARRREPWRARLVLEYVDGGLQAECFFERTQRRDCGGVDDTVDGIRELLLGEKAL